MSAFRRLFAVTMLVSMLIIQPAASAPSIASAPPEPLQSAEASAAAPVEPTAQAAPAATNALADAVRTGKWPAQVAASSGAIRPDRYGPQRTDPAEGIPAHAYSPFDERRNREYPCPPGGCDFVEGQVLVKLAPDVAARKGLGPAALTTDLATSSALAAQGVTALEPIFPDAQPPAAGAMAITPDGDAVPMPDLTRWHRATLRAATSDVYAVVESLTAAPGIAWAEPDYLRKPVGSDAGTRRMGDAGQVSASPRLPLPASFTDPLYAQQWHLGATNVPQAWDWLASQGLPPGGNRDIVVAVIDTGVDLNHPDLAVNIWTNSREIADNGIDDDGNGYVDDIHGADMITNSGNPLDDHGHGTHVAGIIAAQAGNGIGGVGVAYNTQIMAIKAAQYSGVLAASDIAEGIYYAAAQGADVINMSFGGYARSQLEEDALAVAFGQAVLVAAAGNDNKPNLPCRNGRDMYPAAYNWVLGVMASQQIQSSVTGWRAGFSNYDCIARDSHEYELMAPGVDVWSTLQHEQYAAWDGTSMAAPVVSGIAALARTKWNDKVNYSSRFIMGQIAANTQYGNGGVADAYAALTIPPKPRLSYLEHWTFDTSAQATGNDNDGVLDAGETVDLAIVIRNHWGKADPVTVTLEAWAEGASQPDPYVAIITGTVDYGAVGSFNIDDNGLIYDAQGAIIGVRHPFRFIVSPSTPNDHVISFQLTMTAGNGYDAGDPGAPYVFVSRFYAIVQRGVELPRIISHDMTLTKENYYLIPDATLIEAGVHVTATEGTQLQFWSGDPNDPYNGNANAYLQVEGSFITQGTDQEPVELFPSSIFPSNQVRITRPGSSAPVRFSYTRVRNAKIEGSDSIDHCYFDQSNVNFSPRLDGYAVSNSIFHKLGQWLGYFVVGTNISGNLYDSCSMRLNSNVGDNNVFLKNYKRDDGQFARYSVSYDNGSGYYAYVPQFLRSALPTEYNGKVYVALQRDGSYQRSYLNVAEIFASQLGGHVVSINDAAENDFVRTYRGAVNQTAFNAAYPSLNCCTIASPCNCWAHFQGQFAIGLTDQNSEGYFTWLSGEPLDYTNWCSGEPGLNNGSAITDEDFVVMSDLGQWADVDVLNGPVVLELPGPLTSATETALSNARDLVIADGQFNTFHNNAILNVWADANIDHWMRFVMPLDRGRVMYLTNNWWGTTSSTLLDAAIQDYSDNFNLGIYDYTPMLAEPPATAFPFVTDVIISTGHQASTMSVGAETITFTITFNRDMDTAIQPGVSFGPDVPFTDYTTHPVAGGWHDPRTWLGTFDITPITGDGYQFIRIADAVVANDPWLVTGDDSERFRFEIITSGTESMNLQATGGEGRVNLSWTQTDFDLLSGFNLYRATAQDGDYSRINTSIIPPQTRAYTDTAVTPGQPYYYKFTVVKSDMTESDFSNVAQGRPLDTIPPVLSHTPVTSAAPGLPLTLSADVTDNVAVQGVTLYYRRTGTTPYSSQAMVKTTGNRYSATVAGAQVAAPGIEYYIEATDGISTVRHGRPEAPNPVTVVDRPVVTAISPNRSPASGGTAVTIAGSNFKAGASATVGGAACGSLTVVSASQITCVTPPHFPAAVDVTVTNPDTQSGSLLRGFTYDSDTASLSLPATGGEHGAVVQVPINAANVSGLAAASLTVTFDPAVLRTRAATTGSLTPGWGLVANTATAGQIRLSMASAGGAVSGSGVLAYIEFEVIGAAGASSALTLSNVSLNDGAIPVDTAAGSFTVDTVYSIAGMVRFWNGGAGVPGAALTLAGDRLYAGLSNASGAYTVSGARSDDYTLTPGKSDGATGISAYDASLALQHDAGLITLTGYAFTAGDVNKTGAVTAMDAFYILQRAVDLITLPFPGAGAVWTFDPASRSYSNLGANQTGQDFTAVLLGDISGNWSATAAATGSAPRRATTVLSLLGGRPDAVGFVTATLYLGMGDTPVHSLDLTLAHDAAVIRLETISAGPGAAGALAQTNLAEPGAIRLALASAAPLPAGSPLATLRFRLLDPATRVGLILHAGSINEGAVALDWRGGPLRLAPIYLPLLAR